MKKVSFWFKNLSFKTKKLLLLFFAELIMIIIFLFLWIFNVVSYNWLTGFAIGAVASWLAIYVYFKSFDLLFKYENKYLNYFLFLIRIGICIVPFIIAFLIPDEIFNYIGILIGLVPILTIPLINLKVLHQKL